MKKKLLAAGLALATVFLSGCGANTGTNGNSNVSAPPKQEEVKKGGVSSISFHGNYYSETEEAVKLYYLTHNGRQIPYYDFYPSFSIDLKYKNNDDDTLKITIEDESIAKLYYDSDKSINVSKGSYYQYIKIVPLKDGTTSLTVTTNEKITNSVKIIVQHGCNIVTEKDQFSATLSSTTQIFTLYNFYGNFHPTGESRLYYTTKKISGSKSPIYFNYTLLTNQSVNSGRICSENLLDIINMVPNAPGNLKPGEIFKGSFDYTSFDDKPIKDEQLPVILSITD